MLSVRFLLQVQIIEVLFLFWGFQAYPFEDLAWLHKMNAKVVLLRTSQGSVLGVQA